MIRSKRSQSVGFRMRFGRKKKEEKLYQQWEKFSALPVEAVPEKEAPRDILATEKKKPRPRILYILLGVGIALSCVGLVYLYGFSC
jgi:hypothetical protein